MSSPSSWNQVFATPAGDKRPNTLYNIGMPQFRSPFDTMRMVGPNGRVSLHGNIDSSLGSASSSDAGGIPILYGERLFGLPIVPAGGAPAPPADVASRRTAEDDYKCLVQCRTERSCASGVATSVVSSGGDDGAKSTKLCVCSGCPLEMQNIADK